MFKIQSVKIYLLSALVLSIALTSCNPDENSPIEVPQGTGTVYVVNSGPVQNGSGSIDRYNGDIQTGEKNIFYKENLFSPGNKLTDVYFDGDFAFILSSGDALMHLVNSSDLSLIKSFAVGSNPRHIIKARENIYYISDWGLGGLYVYHNVRREIIGEIYTGIGPENMILHDDKVYVTNSGGTRKDSTVVVIDAQTDMTLDTINVSINPNSIQLGANGLIYVLCNGLANEIDQNLSRPGGIVSFSMDSLGYHIEDSVVFTNNQERPTQLRTNQFSDPMYYLSNAEDGSIKTFSVSAPLVTEPSAVVINGGFEGFGINPFTAEIYTSDVLDGFGAGNIYRYGPGGNILDQFKGGVNATSFSFYRKD